jgi:hypothetical protein
MAFEKNPDDLGALWFKTGPKGDYMTGTINGVNVVCFANTKKTNERQPDWRVLKSKPRDGESPAPRRSSVPPPTDDDLTF